MLNCKKFLGYDMEGDSSYSFNKDLFKEASLRINVDINDISSEISEIYDFLKLKRECEIKEKEVQLEEFDNMIEKLRNDLDKKLQSIRKEVDKFSKNSSSEGMMAISKVISDIDRWNLDLCKIDNLSGIEKLSMLLNVKNKNNVTNKDHWRFLFEDEKVNKVLKKVINVAEKLKDFIIKFDKTRAEKVEQLSVIKADFPTKDELIDKLFSSYNEIKEGLKIYLDSKSCFGDEKRYIDNILSGSFKLDCITNFSLSYRNALKDSYVYINYGSDMFEIDKILEKYGYYRFSAKIVGFYYLFKDYIEIKTECNLILNRISLVKEEKNDDKIYRLGEEIKSMFDLNSSGKCYVAEIESLYGVNLKEDVAKFISNLKETSVFYASSAKFLRQLSISSVKDFSKDYGVEMISKKLIPLFDISDAQFIVYDLDVSMWGCFHVDDDKPYYRSKSLLKLLQEYNF